jgi:formate hydrogenlyase subunit 3/multisubunit Na+/H+ antiporter MnhD subunit
MFWYGYVYYIFFNFILLSLTLFILRLYALSSTFSFNLVSNLSRLFISLVVLFFIITFSLLNCVLDYYQELSLVNHNGISFVDCFTVPKLINLGGGSINLTQVYYFPFIYVFLFVTLLSLIFCLSYNVDELMSFMFYVLIILLAGYVLFFTDSIILFFLAYEMLLIPSFFILYKFAKTRRCVEAAYLMFFWTQFGALFLIFGLVYLFFVTGSSQFSVITNFFLSTFEVNFLFLCFIVGFGVKLPI